MNDDPRRDTQSDMTPDMTPDGLRDAYQRQVRSSASLDRRDCPSPDALQRLADESLAIKRRAVMLDHVMGCAHCAPEFALLRSVATAQLHPASTWLRRPWLSPARLAVAATLLVAVGIGGSAWQRSRTPATGPSAEQPATPAPVLRDDGSMVTLVSPTDRVAGTDLRALSWRRVDGADGYVLDVFDTTGALLLSRPTADTVAALNATEVAQLAAGGVFDWMVTARRVDGNERRSSLTRVRIVQ